MSGYHYIYYSMYSILCCKVKQAKKPPGTAPQFAILWPTVCPIWRCPTCPGAVLSPPPARPRPPPPCQGLGPPGLRRQFRCLAGHSGTCTPHCSAGMPHGTIILQFHVCNNFLDSFYEIFRIYYSASSARQSHFSIRNDHAHAFSKLIWISVIFQKDRFTIQ